MKVKVQHRPQELLIFFNSIVVCHMVRSPAKLSKLMSVKSSSSAESPSKIQIYLDLVLSTLRGGGPVLTTYVFCLSPSVLSKGGS